MSTLLASAPEVKVGPQLRRVAESLGYPPVNVAAAAAWFEHRNTVAACPAVEPADVPALDIAASADREADRLAQVEAEMDAGLGGDRECDPADWPAWTDAFTWKSAEIETDGPPARVTSFGPTLDDERYWSLHSPANRDGYTVVSRPHAPRPICRPANDWSDADQLLHHGCV